MHCGKRHWSLLVVVVVVAMTGCANMPGIKGLLPGRTAQTEQQREAYLAMGRLSERQGDAQTAGKIYEAILSKEPQNSVVLHRLGVLAAKNREHDKAAEYFDAAAKAATPSAELLNDTGYNLLVMGRLAEAEAMFRQAIAADSQYKAARNNLGLVLGKTGRYEESLAEFRRAGGEAEAQANLAYAKTQAGDLAGAQAAYRRALTLNDKLKPAADALAQLNRQPDPVNEPHGSPGTPGSTNASPERLGPTSPGIHYPTLSELTRAGQTSSLIESVSERNRKTGRVRTTRAPAARADIAQAAYHRGDQTKPLDNEAGRPERAAAADVPGGQAPSSIASTPATSPQTQASTSAAPTAASMSGLMLSRVFRFPPKIEAKSTPEIQREPTPGGKASQAANSDAPTSPGLPTPVELAEAATRQLLPTGPTRNAAGPNKSSVPTFDPPQPQTASVAAPPASIPPAGLASSAGSVVPTPTLYFSPTQSPTQTNPWQSPTWMPNFAGATPGAMPQGIQPPSMQPQGAVMASAQSQPNARQ